MAARHAERVTLIVERSATLPRPGCVVKSSSGTGARPHARDNPGDGAEQGEPGGPGGTPRCGTRLRLPRQPTVAATLGSG